MADEYLIQKETLDYIAGAVREKAGITNDMTPEEIIREIYLLETDTDTGAPSTGVIFYDYDGTVLYSYTVKEARALTALPAAPTINDDNLTFAGWTHSLEEVNSVMKILHVGAMYTAQNTQFTVDIPSNNYTVNLYFFQSDSNGVTVNWGDGKTSTSTVFGDNQASVSHTYTAFGEYTISFTVTSGTITFKVDNYCLFGSSDNNNICKKIVLSNIDTIIDEYGFADFSYCKSIIISHGFTKIPLAFFAGMAQIQAIILPNSITIAKGSAFDRMTNLSTIVIPNGFDYSYYFGMPDSMFQHCKKMTEIIFPSSLSGLSDGDFDSSFVSFKTIYIMAENPPKLGSTSVDDYCKATIYVPYKSLNAYKTAKNWSTIASYIKPMPIQY